MHCATRGCESESECVCVCVGMLGALAELHYQYRCVTGFSPASSERRSSRAICNEGIIK